MALADYAPVPEEVPQALAGVLLQVLAIVVLRVAFDSRLNRAFALYLTLSAHAIFWGAMDDTPVLRTWALATWPWFGLASPFALAYLALRFREHHGGGPAPRWAGWALLSTAVAILGIYAWRHDLFLTGSFDEPTPGPLYPLSFSGLGRLLSAFLAFWFARRARETPPSARAGLLVAAFGLLIPTFYQSMRPAIALAMGTLPDRGAWTLVWVSLSTAALVPCVMALVAMRRAAARSTLAVGVAVPASALVVVAAIGAGATWASNVVDGTWTALFAGLLTYAVLKGQLVQLDARFRFAISRSTIAAAFVAAFFLASEGAQLVLGDENPWVGLVGAGALVFALAPLQRAAERLAEKAVPVAGAPPVAAGGAEETFRVTLRKYLADGVVTREEEGHLARLATRLGIDAERAHALRDEAEAALGARPPGGA